jgi:hypothetical protein
VPEWLYRREKLPRQDVIRDVQLFGNSTHLHFANAQTAVSLFHHTEFARIADTIRVWKLSRRKRKLFLAD